MISIPKENRKKVLFITDDIRTHSGVAHIARNIIKESASHYNWVVLAGLFEHPQKGQTIDISKEFGVEASVTLYATNNYGTIEELNKIIDVEHIDSIIFITDPRSFGYIWDNVRVIRKRVSLNYLNIWDNYPIPVYNKSYYESCDSLLCINQVSLDVVTNLVGDKNKIIEYIPHGVSEIEFRPLDTNGSEGIIINEFKQNLFNNQDVWFSVFHNSRNIRRKCTSDLIEGWYLFQQLLTPEQKTGVRLVMKTDKVDPNGTDLTAVEKLFFGNENSNIIWIDGKVDEPTLNLLYNVTDVTIMTSSNEGWGLSLTEAMLAGKPFIATLTGGMQDQMRFEEKNGHWSRITSHDHNYSLRCGQWATPIIPGVKSLLGSPQTPYIYDDKINARQIANSILYHSFKSPQERRVAGLAGREFALNEGGFTAKLMTEKVISVLDRAMESFKPVRSFEIIKL